MLGFNVAKHFVSASGAKLTQVTGKQFPLRILHNMRGDGFFSGSKQVWKSQNSKHIEGKSNLLPALDAS